MDSDEELDLMLLAVLLIKKRKRRKRKIWVKEIYKNRKTFGIDGLVREMQLLHSFLKTLIFEYKCYLVNNPYSSSNCLYIFEAWGIPSTSPAPEVV